MMNMMTFPHVIIVIWINKCNLCNVCANGDKVWSWSVFVFEKKVQHNKTGCRPNLWKSVV